MAAKFETISEKCSLPTMETTRTTTNICEEEIQSENGKEESREKGDEGEEKVKRTMKTKKTRGTFISAG
jgi:hypothetical protein